MVGNNFNKTGHYSAFLSDFATPIIVDNKILSQMLNEILVGDWKFDADYLSNNPADGFLKIMYYPFSVIDALIESNGSWEFDETDIWRWHQYDSALSIKGKLTSGKHLAPKWYNPLSGFQLGKAT